MQGLAEDKAKEMSDEEGLKEQITKRLLGDILEAPGLEERHIAVRSYSEYRLTERSLT